MNSTLVRFHGKSYYVDYDDLLNKANNKLFAYEDAELEVPSKLNGQTLMFDKSEMEDKLKKDIKMPTRMPSNLATESSNGDELKILKLLNSKKNEIIKDVISGVDVELETKEDLKQYIKDLAYEYIPELRPVAPKTTTDWRAHESMYSELVDSWVDSTLKSLLKNKGNKMTNEQKLRSYIREYIVEILKEGGDPYGRPDEDKYLFKTGDEYLAGIQGEAVEGGESPEELAAKETAAKEKAEKTAYSRFFSQALAKFGYSGAASIPDEKKREFYDYIDANWTSKQEAPKKKVDEDSEVEFQKRLDSPEPYPYKFNGRTYQVRSFDDEDSTNDFLKKNSDWGVLDVKGAGQQYPQRDYYEVIVAKNEDMGWTDPAGGEHSHDEEDPAKMYEAGYGYRNTPRDDYEIDIQKYGQKIAGHIVDKLKNKPGVIDVSYSEGIFHCELGTDISKYLTPKEMSLVKKVEEEGITETSATSGVAGYETPNAFTGKKGVSKKQKSIANQLGYELVDKSYSVKEEEIQRLDEEKFEIGDRVSVSIGSGLASEKKAIVVGRSEIKLRGDGVPTNVDGAYKQPDWNKEVPIKYEDGTYDTMFKNRLIREGLDTLYFKDESLTAEQKLGLAMRHVRNNLYEVEKIVKKTIKMKNEENIDSTKVGKRTYAALKRINEKVIRLMVAIQDLK